jgi:hypothetical protein
MVAAAHKHKVANSDFESSSRGATWHYQSQNQNFKVKIKNRNLYLSFITSIN